MRLVFGLLAFVLPSGAAELKPHTEQAYQKYLSGIKQSLDSRKHFLLIESANGVRQRIRNGEIFIEEKRPRTDPPDGLIHHWEGAVFIPGATLRQVLAGVQNYDQHQKLYAPEVIASKTLGRDGNEFRVRLRLLKKKILTVVLETEHLVAYKEKGPAKWESESRSTKVAEVEKSGTAQEKELPPGTGHGFVWHLDSFWRFLEADGGVYLECTSVSLSRDIPFGMSRIIRPIVDDLPEESLRRLLENTRRAFRR